MNRCFFVITVWIASLLYGKSRETYLKAEFVEYSLSVEPHIVDLRPRDRPNIDRELPVHPRDPATLNFEPASVGHERLRSASTSKIVGGGAGRGGLPLWRPAAAAAVPVVDVVEQNVGFHPRLAVVDRRFTTIRLKTLSRKNVLHGSYNAERNIGHLHVIEYGDDALRTG